MFSYIFLGLLEGKITILMVLLVLISTLILTCKYIFVDTKVRFTIYLVLVMRAIIYYPCSTIEHIFLVLIHLFLSKLNRFDEKILTIKYTLS